MKRTSGELLEPPVLLPSSRSVNRTLFVAFGVLLSACTQAPERTPSATQSSPYVDYHDDEYNFDVTYPKRWSRAEQQLTILGNPKELLALATFPLRRGGGCAPKRALEKASPTDAIVFLVEFTATTGMKLPRRPTSFDPLPTPHMDECWGIAVSTYRFQDSGGRFRVDVWLGDQASHQTRNETTEILDSLQFSTREHEGTFFERVGRVLEQRDMGALRKPTKGERKDAVSVRELRAKVRRKLANHQSKARLIDIALGVFKSTNKRLGPYRKLMYIVHTGPFSTGDCLEFYEAKTLRADLGSCFLTDRDL
jgi:hypothetical protein